MTAMKWLPKPINGNDDLGMEAPLRAVDIRDTLNHYGGNATDNTVSFFKEENINRWSKHKPIVTGFNAEKSLFVRFDDDVWNTQHGELPSVYIGLGDPNANQLALKEVWDGCSEDECFIYTPPTGGPLKPMRMGDFRGYRADATSPFKSFTCDSTEIEPINGTADFTLNMRFYLNDEFAEADGGMLSLMDLGLFNSNEIFEMVVITKDKNNIYKVWSDGSTVGNEYWGQMNTTIEMGRINSTNRGKYECAVALRDTTGMYYKLPFDHITLDANIYYENDFYEEPWGDAEFNSSSNTGQITLNMVINAGNVTTNGPDFIEQLYIGETPDTMQATSKYGSVSVEKGKSDTLRITFTNEDQNWETFLQFLQDVDEIYIGVHSNGFNSTLIQINKH